MHFVIKGLSAAHTRSLELFNQQALTPQDFRREPGHPPGSSLELINKPGGVATTRFRDTPLEPEPPLRGTYPAARLPALLGTGRPDPNLARRQPSAPASRRPRNLLRDTAHRRSQASDSPRSAGAAPHVSCAPSGRDHRRRRGEGRQRGRGQSQPGSGRSWDCSPRSSDPSRRGNVERVRGPRLRSARAVLLRLRSPPAQDRGGGATTRASPSLC